MSADKCTHLCTHHCNHNTECFHHTLCFPAQSPPQPQAQLPTYLLSIPMSILLSLFKSVYILYRLFSMCAIFQNLKMNAILCPLKLMANAKDLPMRVSQCENKKKIKKKRNQSSTIIPSKDSSMGAGEEMSRISCSIQDPI